MKTETGTVETDLLRVRTKKALRSRRNVKQDAASWNSLYAALEGQSMVLRGLQTMKRWSDARSTRVEKLRAHIEAGTYTVDSMLIAESMLQNQTHFLEEDYN